MPIHAVCDRLRSETVDGVGTCGLTGSRCFGVLEVVQDLLRQLLVATQDVLDLCDPMPAYINSPVRLLKTSAHPIPAQSHAGT